jgi:hypothetical protein
MLVVMAAWNKHKGSSKYCNNNNNNNNNNNTNPFFGAGYEDIQSNGMKVCTLLFWVNFFPREKKFYSCDLKYATDIEIVTL